MKQEPPYEKHTRMLIEMGRHPQALMVIAKWVEAKPHVAEAWFCKSVCEMMLMRAKIALESINKATDIEPNNSRYLAQRARCLVSSGAVMEGLKLARKLVGKDQKNSHILDAVANTISNAGEHEEAIPLFERAIKLNPKIPQYYSNYGTVLHFCQRTDEAEVAHRKALELFPEDFRAYWLLGQLRKAKPDHNFISWFEKMLTKYGDKLQARVSLNFALAKQHEDLGQNDEAFRHLELGSKAALEYAPYNEEANDNTLTRYREEFPPELFARGIGGSSNEEPIVIVGMPRSGTTLVERIIASYDDVFAAGELHNFMHILNERCNALNPGKQGLELYLGLDRLDFRELGDAYVESTRPRTGHTRYFIDKYPFNFQTIGPMALALPRTKIINLVRNPMDTCFSNYKLLFMLGSATYSYDQETLGRFYVQYRKMMEHWHACLPGRILDVDYENLVRNPEEESRRITDFLGFEWRPECLEYYKSDEAVSTASTSQVREPINASSLNAWKKFEAHLEPLKKVFENNGIAIDD